MNDYRKYSDEDIARLREVPIPEVLSDLGYSTKHTAGGLFFSPFKQEKTPSFEVCLKPDNPKYNTWHDWSFDPSRKHDTGDVITLVMELQGMEFHKALEYLADKFVPGMTYTPKADDIIDLPAGVTAPTGTAHTHILKTQDKIWSKMLQDYATQERFIPISIINRYCDQVNYVTVYGDGKTSPERWAIGFPNIDGNYALRSGLKKKGKISTGSNISVINAEGRHSKTLSTDTVCIFEGFFNALSLLAINNTPTPRITDIIVLNSASNTKKAIDWLIAQGKTKKVLCFLDNDSTGDNWTKAIKEACEAAGMRVADKRWVYAGYNDLNDKWIAENQKEKVAKDLNLVPKEQTNSEKQGQTPPRWTAKPKF